MTKVNIYILLFFLLCVGCSGVKEIAQAETVAFLRSTNPYQMDTVLFKNGRTIVLETTKSSLINYADKIILYHDTIAIFDAPMSSVLLFDTNGRYINKIHHVGNGPGEYLKLYDVCLDLKNRCLALLVPDRKILYYSFEGTYLGELSFDKGILSPVKIAIKDDWIYLIPPDSYNYRELENSMYVFNRQTKEAKPIIYDKLYQDCWTFGSQFAWGDRMLFAQRFNNVVYELKGADFSPKYQFVLGDFNLPDHLDREEYTQGRLSELCDEKGYVYSITGLTESKRGILFRSNQPGFFYYDKQSQGIDYYKSIMNSSTKLSYSSLLTLEGDPGKVVFVMRGDLISSIKEALAKYPSDSEEYRKKLALMNQAVADDPNPILFMYELK